MMRHDLNFYKRDVDRNIDERADDASLWSDQVDHHHLNRLQTNEGPELGRDHYELVRLAQQIYHSRREREAYLSLSLFGEPVWDMLLALYAFPPRGERLSVTGLCYAAGVPPTTALRGIVLLEDKKLVSRVRDRGDGRRVWVQLTREGQQVMTRYLSKIHGQLTRS